jgi:hypothetical protein
MLLIANFGLPIVGVREMQKQDGLRLYPIKGVNPDRFKDTTQ